MSEAGDDDISALLDGELSPDEAAAVEARLAASPGAQAEREALGHVAEQVRGLQRVAPPSHFLAAVMAGVIDARPSDTARRGASGRVKAGADAQSKRGASGRLGGTVETLACGIPADDLSAFMDQQLTPERQAEVGAKLGASAPCHARLVELQQVRDRVRGLTRLAPGELFTRQVMARLDEVATVEAAPAPAAAPVDPLTLEERARARSEARATFWRASGWFAQAAGLLLSIGVGFGLTSPPGAGWTMSVSPDAMTVQKYTRGPSSTAAQSDGAAGAVSQPYAPEAIEARLEFKAKSSDAGFAAARSTADSLGDFDDRFLRAPQGDGPADFVITLPANRVDDLALAIDAAAEVDASDETRDALPRITVEQDRVVLKSGFVLAGRLEVEDASQVVVVAGDLRQAVPRRAVERVERANRPRRVWIAVRGEGGR